MKIRNHFSSLEQNSLSNFQLNSVRGGTSGGGSTVIDDDILLPDPEPDDEEN